MDLRTAYRQTDRPVTRKCQTCMQPMERNPSRVSSYAPTELGNPKIFDLVRICKRVKIGDVSSISLLFPGLSTLVGARIHI